MDNLKNNQMFLEEEQLFTEMTFEEAAEIQGGATLSIDAVRIIDKTRGIDDPLVRFGNDVLFVKGDVSDGDVFFPKVNFKFTIPRRLQLLDTYNGDNGDKLLDQRLIGTTPGSGTLVGQGSGYKFVVEYSVV